MKTKLALAICCIFSASAFAADPALSTQKQKLSYTVGHQIGQSLKRQELDVDLDIVSAAIKDVVTGAKEKLTQEEMQAAVQSHQQELGNKRAAAAETNKKQGQAFLEANKKKQGVVTLPSGLQYKVVTQGKGKKPALTDTIEAHYRGTLIDGKEFDSSYGRGEPAAFPVNAVIKGWQEILQLMPEGSKYQVFIPSELAYGETGAGSDIGPNSTLIFDIELIKIK
ncbi:MAG: FKBP-type peptidyl-prolyl cis-trans isomerase [Pseudomonadota bacterium]